MRSLFQVKHINDGMFIKDLSIQRHTLLHIFILYHACCLKIDIVLRCNRREPVIVISYQMSSLF